MLYAAGIISLVIDLLSKYLAVSNLKTASFSVIPNILSFTYVENTGAAFGIFTDGNMFLLVVSLLLFAAILCLVVKYRPKGKLLNLAAGLVLGGAAGNIIDRIFNGFVVDFIELTFINYPVFNIADCCIVCGAILFAVRVIFFDEYEKN